LVLLLEIALSRTVTHHLINCCFSSFHLHISELLVLTSHCPCPNFLILCPAEPQPSKGCDLMLVFHTILPFLF
jgi:hypothetical protein